MGFLASLLAYLGTMTAVVVGLLMGFTAFFYAPDQPTAPLQTAALAAKSSKLVSATNATEHPTSAEAGRWGPRVAPPARTVASITRSARSPKLAARERAARRVVELQRGGRLADQQAPYQQTPWDAREPSYGAGRGFGFHALGFAENSDAERGW